VAELARYRGILEMVRQLPGVESAGAVDSMPGEASAPMTEFEATPGGRFGLWQITDGFLETRPGGELLDFPLGANARLLRRRAGSVDVRLCRDRSGADRNCGQLVSGAARSSHRSGGGSPRPVFDVAPSIL